MKQDQTTSTIQSKRQPVIEAIILAGGLGTRLRDAVPDLPKCMAPVAGRPFLYYVINELRMQGIEKFIFSLGYKHELIERYLSDHFHTLDYQVAIEAEPLGTGGAIQLACSHATEESVVVTNGDTIFRANVNALSSFHLQNNADCTLALKPMRNFDRYGVVDISDQGQVTRFREKQHYDAGLINGGLYILNVKSFLELGYPKKFSFEQEYLEKAKERLFGLPLDEYFIDIGIPEDYGRAQEELKLAPLSLPSIDKDWTIFLDRDGVINVDKPGSYVFHPDEFIFLEGAPELFRKLAERFKYVIVTTNQRGVGKGLMTEEDLAVIHSKMVAEIAKAGGRIDGIYYATSIHYTNAVRKPSVGMALRAKDRFPDIDFSRSIMVGNNVSDMEFGRNAGMFTVFVTTTNKAIRLPHPEIDLIYDTLADFVKAL